MTEFFTLVSPSISLKSDSTLPSDLAKYIKLAYLDKDETILVASTRQEYVYFIAQGYIRSYFKSDDGSETTCWFFGKGDIAFSDRSLLYQQPSLISLRATCASRVLRITIGDFIWLRQSHPEFDQICLDLMDNFHKRSFEYAHTLLRLPRKERLQMFLSWNPRIFGQVKEKDVANFLHMHPNSFSGKKGSLMN